MNCNCIYEYLLTLTSFDVIVHVYMTVTPQGLSLAIGKSYPWSWGDIYRQRKAVKDR